MTNLTYNPLICAIDSSNLEHASNLANELSTNVGMIKLGLEFFLAHGPAGVDRVSRSGEIPFFLDLKLFDIPNTVTKAISSVTQVTRAEIITIHALGGRDMMAGALKAAEDAKDNIPTIAAVTILTSMNEEDLRDVGINNKMTEQILRLADTAINSGITTIVCSPHEIKLLKAKFGDDIKLITPGIRPVNSNNNDQKRTMTPQQAITAGADYLVIGRPITQAQNPQLASQEILNTL